MNRERIAAIIRALLEKTIANGCTEDEAISAAAKAADMLAKYNLTVDEVQLRMSAIGRSDQDFEDIVGERLTMVAGAIATLTGARTWRSPRGFHRVKITFFGFDHEVEIAQYLLAICDRAMRGEARRIETSYILLRPEARRRKTLPFLDGMRDRLTARLLEMRPPTPTGKGLIVVRDSLITAALNEIGMKFKPVPHRDSRDAENTYQDGRDAADRISLNRGLSGKPSGLALGVK